MRNKFPDPTPDNPQRIAANRSESPPEVETEVETEDEITPSSFFFRLRGELYRKGAGDYFKEINGPTLEAWQMNHPKEKIAVQVLDRMNRDYIGHDFNNEGHIHNTFKVVWEKVKKEAPQTATTTKLNFGPKK